MAEIVTLSWPEYETAAYVGFRRGLRVVWSGFKDDVLRVDPHFGAHIDGGVAEYVVSKGWRLDWGMSFKPNRTEGDLIGRDGTKIEVRHTRLPNGGLPVHDYDPADHFAVLVRGVFPTFEIVGGITVQDGQRREFWRPDLPRPCFIVPEKVLLDRRSSLAG